MLFNKLIFNFRFGLYTSPFETELFDMEPPVLPKFSSVPVNYASAVTGEHSTTSATSINCVYAQENFDLRDLLNLPSHSNNELVVPSKLKTLCANYNMRGLLEVITLILIMLQSINIQFSLATI